MRKYYLAAVLLSTMTGSSSLIAAALQVSPTTVIFSQNDNAEQLWLSGTGSELVGGQVRLYRWTQKNGQDVLTDTKDILVSPPVMQVPPGETQIVRLIRKIPADDYEQAYRLIVNELPPASRTRRAPGIQLLLKYSIPVFIAPRVDFNVAPSSLSGIRFSLRQQNKEQFLVADNSRNTHIRLSQLDYVTTTGKVLSLRQGLLGYVLAGGHFQWVVKLPTQPGVLRAIVNEGTSPETLLSVTG